MTTPLARSPFSTPTEPARGPRADLSVSCRLAEGQEERELHHRIREEVFVREQRFFEEGDQDEHDGAVDTLLILGFCGTTAAGAVRAYPLDDEGGWKGDRLAVLPAFRPFRLGAPLVRCAVRSAAERGGTRMIAYVQPQNVAFFERLGWVAHGEVATYVDRPHQRMEIGLS